ncbi:MAG: LapA family protein [Bacteroidetes bacterium]|nr:LapA family protein [Bacteroidota bacterium]
MRQLIIGVFIALMAVVFALQNADPVTVKLYFWELRNTSMALVLIMTLLIGAIAGILFLAPGIYKRNQTISGLKKKISDLEKRPGT